MTKEELREHCEKQVKMCEEWAKGNDREPSGKIYEEHKLILDLIKALEQETYYKNLAQSYEKTINKLTKAIAEQQPSDDCVSRQMAIMCLTQEWNEKDDKTISKFIKKLKALPPVTPTQSWIPVSERLPKESDGAVLITVNGEVNTGRYSEFSNTWYKGDMRGVGGDDPIAWQLLPKPYEEKRGSEND